MTEHESGTRGIKIALAGYSVLVIPQLAAYLVTNILVLLAQALEMLSDVLISAFLLLSASWSRKPADEIHMFGHGTLPQNWQAPLTLALTRQLVECLGLMLPHSQQT